MIETLEELIELNHKFDRAWKRSTDQGERGQLLGEIGRALEMEINDYSPKTLRAVQKRLDQESDRFRVLRDQQHIEKHGLKPGVEVLYGVDKDQMVITKVNTETGRVSVRYLNPKPGKKPYVNTTAISLTPVSDTTEQSE